jgi:hypothetical protein
VTPATLLGMVRTLLQDTDITAEYRYSTPSLIENLNMGLLEMYRIRPDIFLANKFVVPVFPVSDTIPDGSFIIEDQFVPALVYYVVGMTQMRDDEGTQDARGSNFLGKFTSMLVAMA